ncbi:hypothetical protein CYPRO_1987 [Cyclonatronum proteinivorum]|uniref:Uncharacterized protein n=1 Tax=Cyclonatronum proteinivorum TaxID=1457365 RepID=A0A345UL85_9BACT|nr:hypothetical protein CYPRO_1987 [Cyclonatronum proteinivorum]
MINHIFTSTESFNNLENLQDVGVNNMEIGLITHGV